MQINNKTKIVAVLGKSGTGKDTIVDSLRKLYNYKTVVSYTDRPIRQCETQGKEHNFITTEEILHILKFQSIVARTYYNGGNYYCGTLKQAKESDIYVINEEGLDMLVKALGRDNVLCVYVATDDNIIRERLIHRDGIEKANERIEHDKDLFKILDADVTINNSSDNAVDFIEILVKLHEEIEEFKGKDSEITLGLDDFYQYNETVNKENLPQVNEYANKIVQITMIKNKDKAQHLVEFLSKKGKVISKIITEDGDKYKVLFDNGETYYFLENEFKVIEGED